MGKLFSDLLEHWDANHVSFEEYMDQHMQDGSADSLYLEHGMVTCLARGYMDRVPKHRREIALSTRHYGSQYGSRCVFSGYIDGLMDDGSLVENKLKSQWTSKDQEALLLDDQVTCYIAMWALETGTEPEDIILRYHVTRKSSLRQRTTESAPQFLERIEQDIETRPEHYFIEVPEAFTVRSNEQVERWIEDNDEIANRIIISNDTNRWPHNTNACLQYGSLCEMFNICSADSSEVERVIQSQFKERNRER